MPYPSVVALPIGELIFELCPVNSNAFIYQNITG